MKKIFILVLVLSLMWILKLSYDIFNINAQQDELTNTLHRIEQTNANLNDQLVALKRQTSTAEENIASDHQNEQKIKTIQDASLDPIMVIKQQLDLIEFMLKQQKFNDALDRLIRLNNQIDQYALAASLKQSLHEVIEKDQQVIQQFISARAAQQTEIDAVIHQLDQALTEEIRTPKLQPHQDNQRHFWQRWLVIEPAQQPAVALMQRPILLKEAQLRLLLAQQALKQGQYLTYQQSLLEIIQLLDQLPDQKAHQLIQKIQEIKGLTMIPTPVLNTRALLS